jgi:hypothetical protein
MLKVLIVAAVIGVALLRGGSLRNLAALELRLPVLAVIGFALQAAVYILFRTNAALQAIAPAVFVGSLLMLGVWCWLNRRLPGMLVMMLGLLLNAAVISANGGYMPVWGDAARFAGQLGPERLAAPEYDRRWMTTDDPATPLLALGDVLALPAAMPFAGVWSVGDVLLVLGICILCWRTLRAPVMAGSTDPSGLTEGHA